MNRFRDFARTLGEQNEEFCMEAPSMTRTQEFTDKLINLLFPIKLKCGSGPDEIEKGLESCSEELQELLLSVSKSLTSDPAEVVSLFFDQLPGAYNAMICDARTTARFDPASAGIEEIILCYPGFYCMAVYRLARILHKLEVPLIPRVMSEHAHSKTGIDIHPGAQISAPFFIDHGTGVVIGETAVIGENVKIYQGVTLGALTVEKEMANTKRHPTIENNVTIYAGSTILGGSTVIGHDTVVGGNTWITESVLPHSTVYRQHRVVVRDSKDFKPPLDFSI